MTFTDLVDFSDEEGYGKYLDLHECYEKYINLKGIEVSYILTLNIFFIMSCQLSFIMSCCRKWIT